MPSPVPAPRWDIAQPDTGHVSRISGSLGLQTPTAIVLVNRGLVESADVAAFLDPRLAHLADPASLKDMDRAVARAVVARRNNDPICVYGDFDADGMTSTALLAEFLEAAGYAVTTFVPDRMLDGYGVHPERLREIIAKGARLILTVDCGIRSHDEVAVANSLGADVIILDHHEPDDTLPDAAAIVNPHRHDCTSAFKGLAAVGVSFYFVGALRRALIDAGLLAEGAIDLRPLLDLVAVGTIADVVPLLRDNRVFATAGLKRLNEGPRLGLVALKAVAEVDGKTVTAGTVGFHLAPRLNSVGRLSDSRVSLDLLLARDPEQAKRCADLLDRENDTRREVLRLVLDDARAKVEAAGGATRKVVIVAGEGWHPGVVGIVASKLVELYHRPAMVLAIEDGVAKGSCRSVRGFDIGAALAGFAGMLDRFGGHPMAAGLALSTARLSEFVAAFLAHADAVIPDDALAPRLAIDAMIEAGETDRDLARELARLAPFGMGNPEPVFASAGVLVTDARAVGRDRTHLKMTFATDRGPVGGIWFGGATSDTAPKSGDRVDVAYAVDLNDRSGEAQWKVRGCRPATATGLGNGGIP
jgi:single-stranded-DNA-specific exonuclease